MKTILLILTTIALCGCQPQQQQKPEVNATKQLIAATNVFGFTLGSIAPAQYQITDNSFVVELDTNALPFTECVVTVLNDRRIFSIWTNGHISDDDGRNLIAALTEKYGLTRKQITEYIKSYRFGENMELSILHDNYSLTYECTQLRDQHDNEVAAKKTQQKEAFQRTL